MSDIPKIAGAMRFPEYDYPWVPLQNAEQTVLDVLSQPARAVMSGVRRGPLRNVRTVVFFVAECGVCGETLDEDGAEYQGTPDEAVSFVTDCGWRVGDDGLLRCDECWEAPVDPA